MDRPPVREMLTPLARAYSARACCDIASLWPADLAAKAKVLNVEKSWLISQKKKKKNSDLARQVTLLAVSRKKVCQIL